MYSSPCSIFALFSSIILAVRRAAPRATHLAAPQLSQAVSLALLLVQLVSHVMAFRTETSGWSQRSCCSQAL